MFLGSAAQEVLSNESILVELVQNDFGFESPNPCTPYQLKKVGLGSLKSLIPDIGYVYSWSQKVCGIDYLAKESSKQNNKMTADQLSQTNVEFIMKTIKKRLKSRFALAKQLEDLGKIRVDKSFIDDNNNNVLERNTIPTLSSSIDFCRVTISSLTKWSPSDYQTFCQAKHTETLVEADMVSPSDIFYLATFTRDSGNKKIINELTLTYYISAKLESFVVIKNDYPFSPPIFSLCLHYNDTKKTSQNDDNLRVY